MLAYAQKSDQNLIIGGFPKEFENERCFLMRYA